VWGHSQGGGAALWTGALARQYAPNVWVRGVAAFAPASDPPRSSVTCRRPGGLIFASYAFAAYSAIYPDITYEQYIPPGLQTSLRAMSQRCLTDPTIALSVIAVIGTSADPGIFATDPSYGPLGTRLRESVAPSRSVRRCSSGRDLRLDRPGPNAGCLRETRLRDRTARRLPALRRFRARPGHGELLADDRRRDRLDEGRFAGEYADLTQKCTTVDVG
jgi:hypothetical protein